MAEPIIMPSSFAEDASDIVTVENSNAQPLKPMDGADNH